MNPVIAALIAGAVCLVLGVGVGMILRKMLAESKIGTAEKQAERVREEAEKLRERAKDMVAEGRKQAETLKKEAVLAAQEEGLKLKNEMELEIRDRREDMENYIKRLEKLEEIAEGFPGVDKAYAIQAGRELRVMVKPESVSDESMVLVARQLAEKIQSEVKYPGQIKINVIRESRVVSYAK